MFTTTTSAPSGWTWMVWPAAWTEAIICSQFTWFLAQPREIKEMLYGTIESSNRWIVAKWARQGRHVCPIGQGMTAMMWLGRYAHL